MALITDFTMALGNNATSVVITDASTAGYNGETITARTLTINDSSGTPTDVPFPIVSGRGDTVSYDFVTPKSVSITLALTSSSPQGGSVYTKTYTYVILSVFDNYLETLEDNIIYNIDPKSVLGSSTSILRELEWATALYDSAQTYTSTGEIVSAQKCVDSLIELSKVR